MWRAHARRWLAFAAIATAACARAHPNASVPGADWTGSWTAAPQLTEPRNLPPAPGLSGGTLRQVVHLSLGGSALRVRLSNEFGTAPLAVIRAQVARSGAGSAIVAGSGRALTFSGRDSTTIAAGASALSDAVALQVEALSDVTVSLQLGAFAGGHTGHPGSRTTSYMAAGDQVSADSLPSAVRVEHWYFIAGIEVLSGHDASSVVILGNSIADGRGSTTNLNNRWPDNLARRLQQNPRTPWVGVLNAGIGGNAVVRGGLGPPALERLERDVLQQRGARWVIVSEGVNDIGGARGGDAAQLIAGELITAYQQMIARARAEGLRVYGATILPFGGSQYDDASREAARQRVNAWIKSAGAFDAVIDFDAAMRDPSAPARLRADLDSGDHLHPNAAGYVVMAGAVDLKLFRR